MLRELLRQLASGVAPFLSKLLHVLSTILISIAVIIVLLLIIDWLIGKRKSKIKNQKLKSVTDAVVPQSPVLHEGRAAEDSAVTQSSEIQVEPEIKVVDERTAQTDAGEIPFVTKEPEGIVEEERVASFSLQENIKTLSSAFQTECERKNISFLYELDDRLPEKIIGRRNWLNDLLEQLFANALEQTKDGSITLKLKMVKRNDAVAVIQFLVTDSGKGLPGSVLRAVQEKDFSFQSDDACLKSALEKLHSIKRTIEESGGRLTLATKAGEGTTIGLLIEFGV